MGRVVYAGPWGTVRAERRLPPPRCIADLEAPSRSARRHDVRPLRGPFGLDGFRVVGVEPGEGASIPRTSSASDLLAFSDQLGVEKPTTFVDALSHAI